MVQVYIRPYCNRPRAFNHLGQTETGQVFESFQLDNQPVERGEIETSLIVNILKIETVRTEKLIHVVNNRATNIHVVSNCHQQQLDIIIESPTSML